MGGSNCQSPDDLEDSFDGDDVKPDELHNPLQTSVHQPRKLDQVKWKYQPHNYNYGGYKNTKVKF